MRSKNHPSVPADEQRRTRRMLLAAVGGVLLVLAAAVAYDYSRRAPIRQLQPYLEEEARLAFERSDSLKHKIDLARQALRKIERVEDRGWTISATSLAKTNDRFSYRLRGTEGNVELDDCDLDNNEMAGDCIGLEVRAGKGGRRIVWRAAGKEADERIVLAATGQALSGQSSGAITIDPACRTDDEECTGWVRLRGKAEVDALGLRIDQPKLVVASPFSACGDEVAPEDPDCEMLVDLDEDAFSSATSDRLTPAFPFDFHFSVPRAEVLKPLFPDQSRLDVFQLEAKTAIRLSNEGAGLSIDGQAKVFGDAVGAVSLTYAGGDYLSIEIPKGLKIPTGLPLVCPALPTLFEIDMRNRLLRWRSELVVDWAELPLCQPGIDLGILDGASKSFVRSALKRAKQELAEQLGVDDTKLKASLHLVWQLDEEGEPAAFCLDLAAAGRSLTRVWLDTRSSELISEAPLVVKSDPGGLTLDDLRAAHFALPPAQPCDRSETCRCWSADPGPRAELGTTLLASD